MGCAAIKCREVPVSPAILTFWEPLRWSAKHKGPFLLQALLSAVYEGALVPLICPGVERDGLPASL